MQTAGPLRVQQKTAQPVGLADPDANGQEPLAIIIHPAPATALAALRGARILEIDTRLAPLRSRLLNIEARLQQPDARYLGGGPPPALLSCRSRMVSLVIGQLTAGIGAAVWRDQPDLATIAFVAAGLFVSPLLFEAVVCLAACAYSCRAWRAESGRTDLMRQRDRIDSEITPLMTERSAIQRQDLRELLGGLVTSDVFPIVQDYAPAELGDPPVQRLLGTGVPSEADPAETERPDSRAWLEEAPPPSAEDADTEPETL